MSIIPRVLPGRNDRNRRLIMILYCMQLPWSPPYAFDQCPLLFPKNINYTEDLHAYFPTGIIINSAPQNANVIYSPLEVSIAQKG